VTKVSFFILRPHRGCCAYPLAWVCRSNENLLS